MHSQLLRQNPRVAGPTIYSLAFIQCKHSQSITSAESANCNIRNKSIHSKLGSLPVKHALVSNTGPRLLTSTEIAGPHLTSFHALYGLYSDSLTAACLKP
jgi:hypothetical protein